MKAEKFLSSESSTLVENYNEVLNQITAIVKLHNWRIEKPIISTLTTSSLCKSSLSERKKFRDLINRVSCKPTVKNINQLFSFSKRYTKDEGNKVKISLKEEKIQLKRKEWKDFQKEADRLLKEYKEEKGDFYKQK